MKSTGQGKKAVLDRLRVLDLSQGAAGAQASQLLADFGADVVWVEPPGGSELRRLASYPFLARGKRSLVADLKTPEGLETVLGLARTADVLIEAFRPGAAERLGLGYEALAAVNPRLVYTSITGFGSKGPWANIKGYEGIVASVVGAQAAFSSMHAASHPPFLTVPWCSFSASQTALHGTLAALFERERSGRGQHVETSLLQAFASLDAGGTWFLYLISQRWPDAFKFVPAINERGVPNTPATYRTLVAQSADGRWLQFGQISVRLFEAFLEVLGLDWMLTDPKWKGFPVLEDEDLRLEAWELMLAAAKEKTLAEWEAIAEANQDISGEVFRIGPEVLDHPQLVHEGAVIAIADPERGSVRQPGALVKMESTPACVGKPAPAIGDGNPVAWQVAERQGGAPIDSAPTGRLPLEGVTILEFALWYAAPYGATLLTDLGARVIKVESLAGDDMRFLLSFFPEAGSAKVMQGKESVAVDLRSAEGVAIVHELAAAADIVLEGFREGVAKRCRVDADTLLGINPDLVYLQARGYGIDGPCAYRPSFAPTFAATSGISAAQLGSERPVGIARTIADIRTGAERWRGAGASPYAQSDGISALGVATSLLLGLLARERGAGGQRMVTSMLLTNAHLMADSIVDYPGRPPTIVPGGDMRGPDALYRIYDAADGWIFLAVVQPRDWEGLVEALAPTVDLRSDPRFAAAEGRKANDAVLADILAAAFVRRSKHDWQRDLALADVACVAVTTTAMEAVLTSESGRASSYVTDVTHPVFDEHPRLAPLVRFSRSATQAKPGVLCGAATEAVLQELGYTDDQVADLCSRRIVGT